MSPPCQPYTRRGRGSGAADPRSAALAHLIKQIDRHAPRRITLENVPEFEGSDHHRRLVDRLAAGGYDIRSALACPTGWGIPMRRRRFYLWADRAAPVRPVVPPGPPIGPLDSFCDSGPVDESLGASDIAGRYVGAIDTVRREDPAAITACFTSAYGKSPVRAGSYLVESDATRRFAASEITRLMGFRDGFDWAGSTRRTRYRLIGNSVAVPVVRSLLVDGFAAVSRAVG